ncbi:MAG TPA: App1 family protein [Cyclobacteriaceae bacterium]|nr:App1 family protein [Cyclobacteriaceae bacterium]
MTIRQDHASFKDVTVKVFNGYGHQQNLVVYGQVRKGLEKHGKAYTFNVVSNIRSIAKLYFIRPLPFAKVRMQWNDQSIHATADANGFFELQWASTASTPAGWTPVTVYLQDDHGNDAVSGEGKVFIPHITQYGFISDIDDTVLISHSGRTGKKLTTLFTTDPLKRKAFSDVARFYQLLAYSHTEPTVPNPFFYVSSSEWNLYDYLIDFFTRNQFPEGTFLLSAFKRWSQIFKIGNTKHRGKETRIKRIIESFPNQQFVLIGDNSQKDPVIYIQLANEHPDRIHAIYLRIVNPKRRARTIRQMDAVQNKKISVFLFDNTVAAIDHAMSIGLLPRKS